MKKKLGGFAVVLLVLLACLTGCANTDARYNTDADDDYVGWWSFEWRETGIEAEPPFFYAEIDANGQVNYFDEEGREQGNGTLGYNDDKELHFITLYGTEHNVYLGEEDGVRYIALDSTDRFTFSEGKPERIGSGVSSASMMQVESEIDTSYTDSEHSPVGEWVLEGASDLPFVKIEILSENDANDDNIICLDAENTVLDVGTFDADTVQGFQADAPVVISSFPNTGIYATYFSEDGNRMFLAVAADWGMNKDTAEFFSFRRQDVPEV